jgi:hypothetical protein
LLNISPIKLDTSCTTNVLSTKSDAPNFKNYEIIQCGGKGMCREELEIKIEFHDEPKINSILVWNKIACIHKWT